MCTVILTCFDQRQRPVTTVVADGSNTVIYDLYKQNSRKLLIDVKKDIESIRKLFQQDKRIITNNFMKHIKAFGLSQDNVGQNIYDIKVDENDIERLTKLANNLVGCKPKSYALLLARASMAYHGLNSQGIVYNYGIEHVKWSLDTFTKRSKTLGFNLQGFTDEAKIRTIYANEKDILICFDWMAADIRAVAALSDDQSLIDSFIKSDPYTHMQTVIGNGITRDECKLLLLKVVNSLDYNDATIGAIYPRLCEWLKEQDKLMNEQGGISSLLGRRFVISKERSKLSVLNGVIQGSVAHAMHRCIRDVWDRYPHRLIGEIHDSIILNCPQSKTEIWKMIKEINNIMSRPFEGYLKKEIMFPVRISIGNKWKTWKHLYSSRGDKIVSET